MIYLCIVIKKNMEIFMDNNVKTQLEVGDILESFVGGRGVQYKIERVTAKRAYSHHGSEFKRGFKSIHLIVKLNTSKWDHKFFSLKLPE